MIVDRTLFRQVRPAEFGATTAGEIDAGMVNIGEETIERRSGAFEPASFDERYGDALRELVEAGQKGWRQRLVRSPNRPR